MALLVRNPSANPGDIRDPGLIPVLGRPLEDGMAIHSSILAWRTHGQRSLAVRRVAKSQTQLSRVLSTQESAQKLAKSIDDWTLLQESFFI